MPEQRELIIRALIRVYPGKFPSGVCKQVALQQADSCLKSLNKDMMSDGQSSAGKNGITCVTTSVLNNNTLHNDMKGPKC